MMRWSIRLTLLILVSTPCLLTAQQDNVYRSQVKPLSKADSTFFDEGMVVQAGYFQDEDDTDKIKQDEEAALEEEKSEAKEKRDDVAEQIRVAERQVKKEQSQIGDSPGAQVREMNSDEERRLHLLKQLDVILAQREQQTASLADIKKELADRIQEFQNVQLGQLGVEKPFSFLLLDQLQDELATLQSSLASSQSNQSITNEDIVQAKQSLEEKEKEYRLAKEAEEVVSVSLTSDNSFPAMEVKLGRETLEYQKRRLEIQKVQAEIDATRIAAIEEKIQVIRPEAVFSEDDLQTKLQEIANRESELRTRLEGVERDLERSDSHWLVDRKLLKSQNDPTPKEAEELELRRLQRHTLQAIVASSSFRLGLLSQSRQAWENRYQFANSMSTDQQEVDFEKLALANKEQRERDLSNRMLQIDEIRKSISSLETKIESFPKEDDGVELRRLVERQRDAVRTKKVILEDDIAAIQSNRRVTEKLLADIQGDAQRYSLSKIWQATCLYTKSIWNTELTTVDERPITIGKVLIAFAIFVGGFLLSRFLSRRLRRLLTGRLKVEESAAAAFQSLAFYGLVMSFLLGALNFVSIPLTVFTFLGGALAIGVGFGSQNILSNFISGLILLAERPVKVGDLIQMDDLYGNVEAIGARSTIVRTGTNLRLIVPNSKFLENNVVNLTHGNCNRIRTKINVGVAYGSDIALVTKLLIEAAEKHNVILKTPPPFVLFKEFGDSSLSFDLHFWLNVSSPLDRMQLESDLRYQVNALFEEAGVVISFPQRDLHIDSMAPIDIRLLSSTETIRSDAA